MEKTLDNIDVEDAKKKVRDIKVFGDGDTFILLCKAVSESEGWMKSTKVLPTGRGCIVQVSTQQKNPDGSYALAEAITWVPDVYLRTNQNGVRQLIAYGSQTDEDKILESIYDG